MTPCAMKNSSSRPADNRAPASKKKIFFLHEGSLLARAKGDVRPLCHPARMAEMHVSATDFRVHLKDWANQVARGGNAVVMVRYGIDLAVLISWQEYQEFARLAASIEKGGRVEEPDAMEIDLLA